MIHLDRLPEVNPKRIGPAMMGVLTVLQCEYRPEEQAAAMAFVFLTLCKSHRVHPGNVLGIAENIMKADGPWYPELRALRMYIDNEVK